MEFIMMENWVPTDNGYLWDVLRFAGAVLPLRDALSKRLNGYECIDERVYKSRDVVIVSVSLCESPEKRDVGYIYECPYYPGYGNPWVNAYNGLLGFIDECENGVYSDGTSDFTV